MSLNVTLLLNIPENWVSAFLQDCTAYISSNNEIFQFSAIMTLSWDFIDYFFSWWTAFLLWIPCYMLPLKTLLKKRKQNLLQKYSIITWLRMTSEILSFVSVPWPWVTRACLFYLPPNHNFSSISGILMNIFIWVKECQALVAQIN
jgi:hypothetical protein